MQNERVEAPCGAQNIVLESGKLAKQAGGAVTVTYGGTTVLCATCMSSKPKEGVDFFPLMVEYQEKTYAAGKIPGGFFKREGRPTEKEILTARIIDRPIRPLFPHGFFNDVVVTCTVISHDGEHDADVLAAVGASAALTISDIPFNGPIGAVRVCRINGELKVNPTFEERKEAELDFIVVGDKEGIVMLEGEANQVPEDQVAEALQFGLDQLQSSITAQEELKAKVGKEKAEVTLLKPSDAFVEKARSMCEAPLAAAYQVADKLERDDAVTKVYEDMIADLSVFDEFAEEGQEISKNDVFHVFEEVQYNEIRKLAFEKGLRVDGRQLTEVRDVDCEVNILERTHGNGLFQRGQTQSLCVTTLGSKSDEQLMEGLDGKVYSRFMLHYNFPAFSVGEARGSRGPGRREVGHGYLARKSLVAVLPDPEDFPYTIRLVSEILESNGSSSMASVCSGSLAMLAAGVPIKAPVAGISIGMMSDETRHELITDIQGMEDHFGDMDFKVAGTRNGITGIQLDLKIAKISVERLVEAMALAKDVRCNILDNMDSCISQPAEMSDYTPRMQQVQMTQDKIGEVIGPGGRNIRKILEDTGATSIDINDEGLAVVAAPDKESLDKVVKYLTDMMIEPEVGQIYDGVVKKVTDFGCFVEFLPGKQGLVHVSELSNDFVKDVSSVVKEGDQFKVKLVEIDRMKRLNLSKKQAEETAEESAEVEA